MLESGARFVFAFGPTGVAAVAGIVITILKWRTEPVVARLALIGFALLLAAMIVTGAQVLVLGDLTGWTRGEVRAFSTGSGIVILVLSLIGWVLLLFALFSRLTPRAAQPVAAAPEAVDDGAPTGRHVLLDDTGAPVVAQEGTTLSRPWTGPGPMVGVGSDGIATAGDETGSGRRAAAGAGLGIAGAGVAGAAFGAGVFGEPRRGDGPPGDALPTPGDPDASPAVSEDTPTQALALGDTSDPVATGADAAPEAVETSVEEPVEESPEPAAPGALEDDPTADPAAESEVEPESGPGAESAVDPDPRPVADEEPEPATAADDEALASAEVAGASADPDEETAGEPGDDGAATFDESALDDDAYDAYGIPRERPATPAPVVPRRPRPSPGPVAAGASPAAPDLATRAIPIAPEDGPSGGQQPAPGSAPTEVAADPVTADEVPVDPVTADEVPVDDGAVESTDDTADGPGDHGSTPDPVAPEQAGPAASPEATAAAPVAGGTPGAVRSRPVGGPSPLPHRVAGATGPRPAPFSNVGTPSPTPNGPAAPQNGPAAPQNGPAAPQAPGHRPPGFPEPIRPGGADAARRSSDPHPWFTPTGSDAPDSEQDAPEQDGSATDARPGTRTGG